jgi:hypothetical protein
LDWKHPALLKIAIERHGAVNSKSQKSKQIRNPSAVERAAQEIVSWLRKHGLDRSATATDTTPEAA